MNSQASATSTEDPRLAKVRKLLAKAESTTFAEEAATYMAKVSELVAELGIDEALLWAATDEESREQPAQTVVVCEPPYAARKALLVHEIAAALGCKTVRSAGSKSAPVHVSVFGFPTDLRLVEMLVTSLLVQMTTEMLAHTPKYSYPTATTSWRRSFIAAYANRIGERLSKDRAARADADAPTPDADGAAGASAPSTALVLADRDADVNAKMREVFPRIRTTYMSQGSSPSGRSAGRDAANRADIGGARVGGARGAVGSS